MAQSADALLIVDDNEDNRYTLMRRLQRQGYANLTSANDGAEALQLLRERPFDLVLLDIMMPVLNGYQVLEQMRADARLRHVPVIMISALDEMDSVIRCIELGAEDYLAKPFNPTLLRARVGACLEKKRLRDELLQHARRMEKELEAARAIQLSMVPVVFPPPTAGNPLSVYATLRPAYEVGGDLHDCFWMRPGQLCLLVADVSDKGAAAALYMARAKTTLRLVAMRLAGESARRPTPAELVSAANEELCRDNPMAMFLTLVLVIVDTATGAVDWCNAGHTLPCRVGAGGAVSTLPQGRSIPVGVRPAMLVSSGSLQLEPGETLFAYTDGITEATDAAGDFFGEQRLESVLASAAGRGPEELVTTILAAVSSFAAGAPPADDIAAFACRWHP